MLEMVTRVVLFATLTRLWVDLCLAHYSLYISEENLQSYYSNSAYADLIQGQFVPIVDDGEVLIGDGGALLLIEVTSGSGVSGSGYSLSPGHDVTGRSLDYSSVKSLPPFPAHVDTVNFTWISKTMINYTLRATQEGGQLWNPSFGVPSTGLIPRNLSSLQMRAQCRPLAMETGRVHMNLTTLINQSEALVYFFLDKSCNDTVMPSLSTVIQASVTQELNSVTSHSLPFSLSVLLMTTSRVPVFSPTPTVLPHPLASAPILATPGPVFFSSPIASSVTASFLSHTPVLVTDMPSPSSLPTGEPSLSSLSVVSTALVSPYLSSSSIHRTLPPLVELSSSLISTSIASLFLSTFNISPSTTSSFSLSTFNPSPLTPLSSSTLQISHPLYPSTTVSLSTSSPTIMSTPLFQSSTLSVEGSMSTSAIIGNSSVRSKEISTAKVSSSIILTIPGPGDSSSQLLILVCAPIGGILVACILLSLCLVVCFKFKTSKKGAM
ncbi:hypothetical protein GBAR_LOCUS5180 [Geodia barretti]|uniref:WIF domain-containing protein n=1 Tax=Geodia barretti TaxID=519541 RepID=A0AA35W4Q8_GEOBA|nr:hypothetical protein GBAR_LOCUS5180 [Geodia barretti]